jgi:hypothetical protein
MNLYFRRICPAQSFLGGAVNRLVKFMLVKRKLGFASKVVFLLINCSFIKADKLNNAVKTWERRPLAGKIAERSKQCLDLRRLARLSSLYDSFPTLGFPLI